MNINSCRLIKILLALMCSFFFSLDSVAVENDSISDYTRNTVYTDVGYSFIVSRFTIPAQCSGNPKRGPEIQLGYDWVSRKGIGVGAFISNYRSSYHSGDVKISVVSNYFASQFVMKQRFNHWFFEERAGMGYLQYRESAIYYSDGLDRRASENVSGLGCNITVGTEYRFSRTVGIALVAGFIKGWWTNSDKLYLSEKEHAGVLHFFISSGIRIHF